MNLHEVSFWYHYLVGGVIFLIGLALVLRSGEMSLGTSEGRWYFVLMVGGFGLYAVLHGLSVYTFPYM